MSQKMERTLYERMTQLTSSENTAENAKENSCRNWHRLAEVRHCRSSDTLGSKGLDIE